MSTGTTCPACACFFAHAYDSFRSHKYARIANRDVGAGAAMLLYFGLLTYLRADMYGDDFRRTQIEAQYLIVDRLGLTMKRGP